MNGKRLFTAVLALFFVLSLSGCINMPPEISDDEILLQIKLDVREDIGLLVIDYDANGSGGSGGTSNANKSLLKHDELILYTIDKSCFDNPSDVKTLSLRFTVITVYVDPNYDNLYPQEYTMPMNTIYLDVNFGESYSITITGDNTNGYTASSEQDL